MKKFYDFAEIFCVALIAVVFTVTFFFRVIEVDGDSMQNTLSSGDRIIISHVGYTPETGDIVVTDSNNGYGKPLIKRVIAIGGDRIRIDYSTGEVYVNGAMLKEDYIKEKIATAEKDDLDIIVPDGCVFLMGDNRNSSFDSRYSEIGPIEEECILGKAVFRLSPVSKMGFIK